jgi:hypothetical protein
LNKAHTMTKQEEIQVLHDAAARLGLGSYCGPWLLEVIAAVERDIRADLPPIPTIDAWRRECAAMEATAKEQAAEIVATAKDRAAKREDEASRHVEHASSTLRDALRALGSF